MNQALPSLENLLEKTAGGDRAAFQSLYERSSGKLFGVILRILKNKEKSEDVLQDVFLKIWQKAGSYDSAYGKPITWMATIARNRAIDIVRATRPTQTLDEPGDEEDIFGKAESGAAGVEAEDLETLRFCLGEMKEDARKYVLLAYYEGYSREELAEKFSQPIGTIKTRLRRGLQGLRACLEGGAS